MDEEKRMAAEKAGSELIACKKKARTGQVKLEDDHQPLRSWPNEPQSHIIDSLLSQV
jgi:hypothetical protein